jgi:hypothetical protein
VQNGEEAAAKREEFVTRIKVDSELDGEVKILHEIWCSH